MIAGDWIKMTHALRTAPETVRISVRLKTDIFRTIGGLHSVWCIADQHATDDGLLPGYTLAGLSLAAGWPEFAEAMADERWLIETDQGVEIPNFERHNSETAKKRALDAARKRSARLRTDSGHTSAERPENIGQKSEIVRPREEVEVEVEKSKKKTSEVAPRRNATAEPPFIEFPIVGEGPDVSVGIPQGLIDEELIPAYPGVDVPQQLRAMRSWLITNPTRRKTRSGVGRFITSWLSREQNRNRGGDHGGPTNEQQKQRKTIESVTEVISEMFSEDRGSISGRTS